MFSPPQTIALFVCRPPSAPHLNFVSAQGVGDFSTNGRDESLTHKQRARITKPHDQTESRCTRTATAPLINCMLFASTKLRYLLSGSDSRYAVSKDSLWLTYGEKLHRATIEFKSFSRFSTLTLASTKIMPVPQRTSLNQNESRKYIHQYVINKKKIWRSICVCHSFFSAVFHLRVTKI